MHSIENDLSGSGCCKDVARCLVLQGAFMALGCKDLGVRGWDFECIEGLA